ncbi:hypothetical protein FRC10_004815 [Ceratobasidium sp. 414]|nr:hypothetical protein FRC10_004815 [Ceratobasidium sp. 414]
MTNHKALEFLKSQKNLSLRQASNDKVNKARAQSKYLSIDNEQTTVGAWVGQIVPATDEDPRPEGFVQMQEGSTEPGPRQSARERCLPKRLEEPVQEPWAHTKAKTKVKAKAKPPRPKQKAVSQAETQDPESQGTDVPQPENTALSVEQAEVEAPEALEELSYKTFADAML